MKVGVVVAAVSLLATQAMAQDPAAVASSPILFAQKVGLADSLPVNSEIWLSLNNQLSSHTVQVGSRLSLTVSRDVMAGDYIVIPRGSPASGRITYRTGKGAWGKSAKMEFELTEIQLGDRSIPVAGHYRLAGEGNTGATIGAIAIVGVVGAAFVTGHSATAAQGSEWRAYTTAPLKFARPIETAASAQAATPVLRRVSTDPVTIQPEGRKLPHEDVIEVIL